MKVVALLLLFVALAVSSDAGYMIKLAEGVQPQEFASRNGLNYLRKVGSTGYDLFKIQVTTHLHMKKASYHAARNQYVPTHLYTMELFERKLRSSSDVVDVLVNEEVSFQSAQSPGNFAAGKQEHLVQLKVPEAWTNGKVSGKDVTIMLVDNDGPYSLNNDLTNRINQASSFNFATSQEIGRNPNPVTDDCKVGKTCEHGTSMATLMAGNAVGCSPGPAYNSYVSAVNRPLTQADFIDAYSVETDVNYSPLSVYFCQPTDTTKTFTELLKTDGTAADGTSTPFASNTGLTCTYKRADALIEGQIVEASTQFRRDLATGQKKLGILHLFPAGNTITPRVATTGAPVTANRPANGAGENTYGLGLLNNPWVYVVGGVTETNRADISTRPGAAVVFSAPIGTSAKPLYYSTTRFNDQGIPADSCGTQLAFGTSNAGALVTGVVALMMEADRNLTPRDVVDILIKTSVLRDAVTTDPDANQVVTNKATPNRKWSPWRGFGTVNAEEAIKMVQDPARKPVAELMQDNFPASNNARIASGTTAAAAQAGMLVLMGNTNAAATKTYQFYVAGVNMEYVETFSLLFSAIMHTNTAGVALQKGMGALQIKVTSAAGTTITLKNTHVNGGDSLTDVRITTRAFYGENPVGLWKIEYSAIRSVLTTQGITVQNIQILKTQPSVWGAKGTFSTSKCCAGNVEITDMPPAFYLFAERDGEPAGKIYNMLDNNARLISTPTASPGVLKQTFVGGKHYTFRVGLPTFPVLTGEAAVKGDTSGPLNKLPSIFREIALKRPFIHRCTFVIQKDPAVAAASPWGQVSLRFFAGFSQIAGEAPNTASDADIHTLFAVKSERVLRTSDNLASFTIVIERAFRAAENPQMCWMIGAADKEEDSTGLTTRQTKSTTVIMGVAEQILPADTVVSEDNSVEISFKNLVRVM